jgi:hypothetical protein
VTIRHSENGEKRFQCLPTKNNGQPWLLAELEGVKTNRQGLGAEVGVLRPGGRCGKILWRRSPPDGSYVSYSGRRVHFGLGGDTKIDGVVVRWVGGAAEVFRNVRADSIARLKEGTGQPWQ